MKLQMVIFDLDGTVIDNHAQYKEAFKKVLLSLSPDAGEFEITGSIGIKENWPFLLKKFNINTSKTADELAILTQVEYVKLLDSVAVRGGFAEFVAILREKNIETGLATSNTWEVTNKVLEKFGIEDLFDIVTTAEEAPKTKPDPELFLLTARKRNIEPQNCVVFEDAPAGITAAHEAGMKVIAVADEYNEKILEDADMAVSGYNEISLKEIEEL